jgi:polysaccharide biosynthesis protein PslH
MQPLRILFISPYVPSLVRTRPYNFIRHLARKGHQITVLAVRTSAEEKRDADLLARYCSRVETIPVTAARSMWNCTLSLFAGRPLQASYCYSPSMRKILEITLEQPRRDSLRQSGPSNTPFDLVHIEHLRGARFGRNIKNLPCVFDSVDCISLLFQRVKQNGSTFDGHLKAWLDLDRTRRFEGSLLKRFSRVLISTEEDRQALTRLCQEFEKQRANGKQRPRGSGIISIVPNGVDLEYFQPGRQPREPAQLIYVGRMNYHANIEAALYLVREIMPLIWAKHPKVILFIVGDNPSRQIKSLASRYKSRVIVTGYVPDVRPHLWRSTISINPLVYAVGSQNKLLEAMATATPVVATSQAAAAIGARDTDHLLVADDREAFAKQALQILENPALREGLGRRGRSFVESRHAWTSVVDGLETIYRMEIDAARVGAESGRSYDLPTRPILV